MGNAIPYESRRGDGLSKSELWARHCQLFPNGMERRWPFLEEPITVKHTERGEAPTSEIAQSKREDNAVSVNNNDTNKLRYAASEMQGWRAHMEDRCLLNPKLFSSSKQEALLKGHHLFAVFDGHSGDDASDFCSKHFVSTLVAQNDWKRYLKMSSEASVKSSRVAQESVTGIQLLKSALTAAFHELDTKLMKAQRQRRLSQLLHLKDIIHAMDADVEYDAFEEGTSEHERVTDFTIDSLEIMDDKIPLERSGCTAVVVLITPSHILCANAGDSRAILSKKSVGSEPRSCVLPLSFDHKPHNDVEVCRVERDGGFVRTRRVDGNLSVSRGFGDFKFKKSAWCGDAGGTPTRAHLGARRLPKDNRVTVHPDIIVHTRESIDEFVVLGCDGIWEKLSNRRCANLVRDLDESEPDAGLICEEVLDTTLELDGRDNMTCCVVFFPASGAGTLRADGGVQGMRAEREKAWGGVTPAARARLRLEGWRKRNRSSIPQQGAEVPKSPRRGARSPSPEKARAGSQSGPLPLIKTNRPLLVT